MSNANDLQRSDLDGRSDLRPVDRRRAPVDYSETIHNEVIYSEAIHSEAIYSETIYNEVIHSKAIYSEAIHNEAIHSVAIYSEQRERSTTKWSTVSTANDL